MVRACGSYPQCPGFNSLHRHQYNHLSGHHSMPVSTSSIRQFRFPFILLSMLFFFVIIEGVTPMSTEAAEKKEKKPQTQAGQRKDPAVSHGTIHQALTRAQEYTANKEFDKAQKLYEKTYGYAADVLAVATLFEKQYDKAMKESSLSQGDKENIYLKLKRVAQLSQRYKEIKLSASYGLGYLYAKKGDGEKAKKYLMETIESSPVSLDPQSAWMKSRKLLLELYELEGEF